jgi:DNA-binding MarR family transcriptional regulator
MSDKKTLVVNDFIRLTERIANGKMNVLNFGSEEMTFYRGEIHMIKMVGDYPGIFISEMARNFNVTRAVVAKTIHKLEERGLIRKEEDENDKKKLCLYLTEKGMEAHKLHHQYHKEFDSPLFDYLNRLNCDELELIQEFLKHANELIDNHF